MAVEYVSEIVVLTLELLFKGDFQFTEIFHWNFYLVQTLPTERQFNLAVTDQKRSHSHELAIN